MKDEKKGSVMSKPTKKSISEPIYPYNVKSIQKFPLNLIVLEHLQQSSIPSEKKKQIRYNYINHYCSYTTFYP